MEIICAKECNPIVIMHMPFFVNLALGKVFIL